MDGYRRITVEEVKEAYEQTGIEPVSGTWGDETENCACALTTMVTYKTGKDLAIIIQTATDDEHAIADNLDLSIGYFTGFINGFDNAPKQLSSIGRDKWFNSTSEYLEGYEDGSAARREINPS